jgi:UDP-N-acetyl-D-mannosaminuronic acid dehydrogenase
VFEAAGIDFTGGLVLQVVEDLRRTYDIANMTVELLGMAFKAEIEDTRASLSYKLKRTLQMSAREGHSSANALRRERIAIFEVAEY